MSSYFKIEKEKDVAVVVFDRTDGEMNILSETVLRELNEIFEKLDPDPAVRGVVLISGKKDQFIVGADISEIQKLTTVEAATNGSRQMQLLFQKIHTFSKPVVCAIHGTALGGGCELALACMWRIASSNKKTKIGLPEIQLGLIPGAGGTQRLPRLIGIQTALDMILTGKQLEGSKALKVGLVDACVPEQILRAEAVKLATKKKEPSSEPAGKKSFKEQLPSMMLEGNFIGRRVMRKKAKEMIDAKTKGFYPASYAALEAVFDGIETNLEKGLEIEARLFGELAATQVSKALIHLFHSITAIKKHPYKNADVEKFGEQKVRSVGVVGAGFMGAGITNVCIDKGIPVFVSDPNKESISRLLQSAKKFFWKKVERRRLKNFEAASKLSQISPGLSPKGLEKCDIVIEAVFEDLKLKQKILAGLEEHAKENFIFASNTSAIPISDIAQNAKMPERVVGMHFFSPVEKMPLLEIVVTNKTAPWVAARAVQLGQTMGKQVIVVKDSPGFYTTRALAFYLAEAARILAEGVPIETIDKVLTDFGFPVGPITLIDEVGIDVGIHVLETIEKAFPERLSAPRELQPIADSGRLGRKNSKGFYLYKDGKKEGVDTEIYKLLSISNKSDLKKEEIVDRCALLFVNESIRCLEEKVLPTAYEGDVGAVFGLGFPPFLGGPFKYVDLLGAKTVVERLKALEEKHGSRFAPTKSLVEMAQSSKRFFPDESI